MQYYSSINIRIVFILQRKYTEAGLCLGLLKYPVKVIHLLKFHKKIHKVF